jgi:hypothetical protein
MMHGYPQFMAFVITSVSRGRCADSRWAEDIALFSWITGA